MHQNRYLRLKAEHDRQVQGPLSSLSELFDFGGYEAPAKQIDGIIPR